MLISRTAIAGIGGHNIKHFRELGYDVKMGSQLTVPIEQLTEGSNAEVEVQCDYCGQIVNKKYKSYLRERKTIAKDACSDCRSTKEAEVVMAKYGVDNVFDVEEFREKQKETLKERYGFEYVQQIPFVKEKTRQSNLEKFGVENPMQSEIVREKGRQTSLERYGVASYRQTDECRERIRKTNLEKYGVEWTLQSEEIREKGKQTLILRYGADNYFKTDAFRQRMLAHWGQFGVKHNAQLPDFKQKVSRTWNSFSLEKRKAIRQKSMETCLERYGNNGKSMVVSRIPFVNGARTSKPQLQLYNILKEIYENTEINYPIWGRCLDIALSINGVNLDVEYDGWFWHNDRDDVTRDGEVLSLGYKILRIKSGRLLPDTNDLITIIDNLVVGKEKYAEIILPDWQAKAGKNE